MVNRKKWLKSVRLPVPVVIVGNIFVGGTGKIAHGDLAGEASAKGRVFIRESFQGDMAHPMVVLLRCLLHRKHLKSGMNRF